MEQVSVWPVSKTDRNVIGRRRRLPSGVSEMVFGKCWPAIKHLSLPNTADPAALLSRTEGIMVQRLNFLHRYTIHTDVYIYILDTPSTDLFRIIV